MSERFVLDCSVAMAWCFRDENCRYGEEVFEALSTNCEAVVPNTWPVEVVNVLLVGERHRRIREAEGVQFLEKLKSMPIYVQPHPLPSALLALLAQARAHGLSA